MYLKLEGVPSERQKEFFLSRARHTAYEYALGGVVACNAVKLPLHGDKVVFPKLREGPSQEQQVQPGVGKRQQNELSPHRPALASAACAAVCGVPCSGQEEFLLPFARNAFKL